MKRGSPLYHYSALYHGALRVLYRGYYEARFKAVAERIRPGESVVDVCSGDCRLYDLYLRPLEVRYVGLDCSAAFVAQARRKGIDARHFDLWRDPLPPADVILMQGSLYQFIPQEEEILAKLQHAARDRVIIAEPISNIASHKSKTIQNIVRRATTPDGSNPYLNKRFDQAQFLQLLQATGDLIDISSIAGGREAIGIVRGKLSRV